MRQPCIDFRCRSYYQGCFSAYSCWLMLNYLTRNDNEPKKITTFASNLL